MIIVSKTRPDNDPGDSQVKPEKFEMISIEPIMVVLDGL